MRACASNLCFKGGYLYINFFIKYVFPLHTSSETNWQIVLLLQSSGGGSMSSIEALFNSVSYSVKEEGNCETCIMKVGKVKPQSIIPEFIWTNMQFSQDILPEDQDITLGSATDEAVVLTTKYVSPNNMSSALGKYESCFTVRLYAEAYISTYRHILCASLTSVKMYAQHSYHSSYATLMTIATMLKLTCSYSYTCFRNTARRHRKCKVAGAPHFYFWAHVI